MCIYVYIIYIYIKKKIIFQLNGPRCVPLDVVDYRDCLKTEKTTIKRMDRGLQKKDGYINSLTS